MMTVEAIMKILRERLGEEMDSLSIPPPVFIAMGGEFVNMDLKAGTLTAWFPVQKDYLNPYGAVQGGMVAAAVDNTLGPLSLLVAPPNVTRRLAMKFSRAITPEMRSITVEGRFLGREDRMLEFAAVVRNPAGDLVARAKATHWILTAH